LIAVENSLLIEKNSLLGRVGNLACKGRKTKEKFERKISPDRRFCENSLLNSLQPGNLAAISGRDATCPIGPMAKPR
jgi:hypothetical protein